MMHTLKIPRPRPGKGHDVMSLAADMNPRTYAKLQALNNVRAGRLMLALMDLNDGQIVTDQQLYDFKQSYLHKRTKHLSFNIHYYGRTDWNDFSSKMILLANDLKAMGL